MKTHWGLALCIAVAACGATESVDPAAPVVFLIGESRTLEPGASINLELSVLLLAGRGPLTSVALVADGVLRDSVSIPADSFQSSVFLRLEIPRAPVLGELRLWALAVAEGHTGYSDTLIFIVADTVPPSIGFRFLPIAEPGSTMGVLADASDNVGIEVVTVQVTGGVVWSETRQYDYPLPQGVLVPFGIPIPIDVPYGTEIGVKIRVVDVAGMQTSDTVTVTVRDLVPPDLTLEALGSHAHDMGLHVYLEGDTATFRVRARDPSGLRAAILSVDTYVRDSLSLSGDSAEALFRFEVPQGGLDGKLDLIVPTTVTVADGAGNAGIMQLSTRFVAADSAPIARVATGSDGDAVYDAARGRLYVATPTGVRVFSIDPFVLVDSIPFPPFSRIDLLPDASRLVVGIGQSLYFVDLDVAGFPRDTFDVPNIESRTIGALRVLADGRIALVAASASATDSTLRVGDVGTGQWAAYPVAPSVVLGISLDRKVLIFSSGHRFYADGDSVVVRPPLPLTVGGIVPDSTGARVLAGGHLYDDGHTLIRDFVGEGPSAASWSAGADTVYTFESGTAFFSTFQTGGALLRRTYLPVWPQRLLRLPDRNYLIAIGGAGHARVTLP